MNDEYIKNPKSICFNCEYRNTNCSGPSTCDVTKVTHPVTGKTYNTELCANKNRDGNCPDFKEDRAFIVIGVIAVVIVVVIIGGLILG